MTAPALFENIVATGEKYADLPEPVQPYFVFAKEGIFLHRATALGNVLTPQKPKRIGSTGYQNGVFYWKAPLIPGAIISQAHDFFRRIYRTHHTESEVIITYHTEQKRYRLFVPLQRVSHTGVKSIFEPSHIQKDWLVVGTLHSHCNFSAFHSGTDSADASDMDGVHFTIGFVERDEPEIVAMVAMNGKEFHYADPTTIADIEFGTATAPEWWDAFVYPAQTPTNKPKNFKSISDAEWNEFKGIHVGVTKTATKPGMQPNGYQPHWSNNDWNGWDGEYGKYDYHGPTPPYSNVVPFTPTKESQDWNRRHQQNTGRTTRGHRTRNMIVWRFNNETNDMCLWDLAKREWVDMDPATDDPILDGVIDDLMARNLISDEDFALSEDEVPTRKNISEFILRKIALLADLADTLGMQIDITVDKPAIKTPDVLPGQMTVEDAILPEN